MLAQVFQLALPNAESKLPRGMRNRCAPKLPISNTLMSPTPSAYRGPNTSNNQGAAQATAPKATAEIQPNVLQ